MSLYQQLKQSQEKKKLSAAPKFTKVKHTKLDKKVVQEEKPPQEPIMQEETEEEIQTLEEPPAQQPKQEEIVIEKTLEESNEDEEEKIKQEKTKKRKRVKSEEPKEPKEAKKKEKITLLDFIVDSYSGTPTKATGLKLENQKKQREKKKALKSKRQNNPFYQSDEEEEEEVIMSRKDKQQQQQEETKKTYFEKEKEMEEQEQEDLFPQIQIINGEIVLNQDSITIKRPEVNFEKDYERVNETQSKKFTSATYSRYPRTPTWSREENEKFYDALSQLGTNFSQIAQFFPNRDRRQIRNKFKKEEKENKLKVEYHLKNRKPLNIEGFLKISKEALEERLRVKEREEEEKKRKEQEELEEEEWSEIGGSEVKQKIIDEGEYVDTGENFELQEEEEEEEEEEEFDDLI